MAAFEFSRDHNAFAKECSVCKKITIGTRDQTESEAIFAKFYAIQSSAPDGLQPRCRTCNHARRLSIGVTHEMFLGLIAQQDNVCAICGETLTRPHVDHNHDTGQVRGVLCPKCNLGLSFIEDNKWFDLAKEYLVKAITIIKTAA